MPPRTTLELLTAEIRRARERGPNPASRLLFEEQDFGRDVVLGVALREE
jgi:hypothetical protein